MPHSDETLTLKLPASSLDLGTPPRLCYPLVIILFRTDNEGDIHPDETVNSSNLYHPQIVHYEFFGTGGSN